MSDASDEPLARIAELWAISWQGDGASWGGDDSKFVFETEGFRVECFETPAGAAWKITHPRFPTKRGKDCPTLEDAMREAWVAFAEVVWATGAGTRPTLIPGRVRANDAILAKALRRLKPDRRSRAAGARAAGLGASASPEP